MRMIHLVKKELIEILRQRELLFLILVVPLVEIVLLGHVIATETRNLPVQVVNLSESPAAGRIIREVANCPGLRVPPAGRAPLDAFDILRSGRAKAVVTVRDAPSPARRALGVPEIQILLDGTDAFSAAFVEGALQGVIARSLQSREAPGSRRHAVSVKTQIIYNPDLKPIFSSGTGLVGLLLTFLTFILAALTLVREKEQQTLDTLLVSKLTPLEIFAGKGLPAALVGLFQLLVGLPILLVWFKVPFRGSAGWVLLGAVTYLLAVTSLALAVSALSSSHRQAMFLAWYIIMTFLLLSGFFTPVENIPPEAWLSRAIAAVNPFLYLMRIVRTVMLKGGGWSFVRADLLVLSGLSLVFMTVSYALFRRSLKR